MRKKSKRSKKSNRISWASGDELCQVKLFSSEDCPAIVGLKSQDDLQAKKPETFHSYSNDLPPGFDSISNQSHASQILWKRPPKFALNHAWQVASGEESEEVKRQNSREPRVLEAVYPRFSAIPSGPSVSPEVEREHYDDTRTPIIPITPIEEEEEEEEENVETLPPINTTTATKPVSDPKLDTPLVALAEAIRTSNEKGSLIDTDLLIKILSNKQMIQRLMVADGASASEPKPTPAGPPPFHPVPVIQDSLRVTVSPIVHQEARPAFQHVVRPPIPEPARPPSFVATHEPVKDMNYYKNLIRQHGEEKEEIVKEDYYHRQYEPKPANNNYNHQSVGESRNKNTRPCVFFNTPRGCLKGASCQFQHDVQAQWRPPGNVFETSHHNHNNNTAKRMKLSGEINGGMLV